MTAKSIPLLYALLGTFPLASAALAETENERDFSLSVFGSWALIEAPDISVNQATHDVSFTGFDLDVPLGANHFVGGLAMHF